MCRTLTQQEARSAQELQARAAAHAAEERKAKRYGDGTGGVFVYPFVIEAWGGIGDSACTVLDLLAPAFARKCRMWPHALNVATRKWRVAIGAALYRAQASIYTSAYSETAVRVAPEVSDRESDLD